MIKIYRTKQPRLYDAGYYEICFETRSSGDIRTVDMKLTGQHSEKEIFKELDKVIIGSSVDFNAEITITRLPYDFEEKITKKSVFK